MAVRTIASRLHAADKRWRDVPSSDFSCIQKEWVTCGGSLTARLCGLGAVSLRVMREATTHPWADEHAVLNVGRRTPVWCREVVISVNRTPFVVARSIAPLSASLGAWRAMRKLMTRPLADLLYSDAHVRRSSIASCRLGFVHPLHRLAVPEIEVASPSALVARRSVFERHAAPLLVSECLLPALWREVGGLPRSRPPMVNGLDLPLTWSRASSFRTDRRDSHPCASNDCAMF
jgi:chorismate--pyruvate lyase